MSICCQLQRQKAKVMIKVGITGGIGSGKTAVCEVWSEMGGFVLNADAMAKQLMTENKEVKQQLVDTFGPGTFDKEGGLNRAYLANQAFRRNRVVELNAIVHPKLPPLVQQEMEQAAQSGFKVGIYEAALLLDIEDCRLEEFDYIALVLTDKKKRIQRVIQRDETDRDEIKSRMDKQRDFEDAKDQADIIIRNNGTLSELREKAISIFEKIKGSDG